MKITSMAAIPIERDGEDVGVLRFDPSDVAFMERVYAALDAIDGAQAGYEKRAEVLERDTTTDAYGIPSNGREQLKLMRELCVFIRGQIDSIFGEGTSEMVFGGALSIDMLFSFLAELAPHLEEVQAERVKKYANRAQRRATLRK